MRIRKARKREMQAVLEMDRACFPGDTREDFRRSIAVWWVVEDEGKLVAYASGYPWRHGNENAFILSRCGVLHSHRGKGLQRRLLRARIAHAKRQGHRLIWTYTFYNNVVSSNNLIREGFLLWEPGRWQGVLNPTDTNCHWLYWKRKVV